MKIVIGEVRTCGLTSDGSVYCWGDDYPASSGATSTINRTPVLAAGGAKFVSLAVGANHSCGLTGAGATLCWGSNTVGELGDGTTTYRATPAPIAGAQAFVKISVNGGNHSCGLTAAGAVYCWGLNTYGEIGDGTVLIDGLVPTATKP